MFDDAVSKDCFYRLLEYQLKVWIIEVPVGIYIYILGHSVKPHPPLMFWDSHSLGSAVRSPARHHGQVYARHEEEGGEGQGNTMDFHDGFHGGETWDETRWMTKRW